MLGSFPSKSQISTHTLITQGATRTFSDPFTVLPVVRWHRWFASLPVLPTTVVGVAHDVKPRDSHPEGFPESTKLVQKDLSHKRPLNNIPNPVCGRDEVVHFAANA